MKQTLVFLFLSFSLCLNAQRELTIKLSNKANKAEPCTPYVLKLKKNWAVRSAVVKVNQREVASQLDDFNGDGIADELCFVINPNEVKGKKAVIHLYKTEHQTTYKPRVYAQLMLRNPKVTAKNKHDIYLKALSVDGKADAFTVVHHHGIAFESELVAYRVYFDHRQTIDLYGKNIKQLEIKDTQFYRDSLQKAAGYGDDVLWVGNTFGLGTLRGWDGSRQIMFSKTLTRTQRIIANGPVRTICEIEDKGWEANPGKPPIDMTIRYTLYAGHRDCQVEVSFGQNVADYRFTTGLINVKNSVGYTNHKGVCGCWGTDWPAGANNQEGYKPETVGLGINIPIRYIVSEQPKDDNYGFIVRPIDGRLSYSISFCSANESFGYHTAADWFEYLENWT